jgi:uncharacterized protein YegL
MTRPPLKTMRDISELLKNPPYHEVDMMCDSVIKMCNDFNDSPYAKPFAKLSVVANALRTKSTFEFKNVRDVLMKQCLISAQEVADITKKSVQ